MTPVSRGWGRGWSSPAHLAPPPALPYQPLCQPEGGQFTPPLSPLSGPTAEFLKKDVYLQGNEGHWSHPLHYPQAFPDPPINP